LNEGEKTGLDNVGAKVTSEEIRNWVRAELWDQVPVSISVIDRDYKIVEANRMFNENYGG
jgi:hypothetical protein